MKFVFETIFNNKKNGKNDAIGQIDKQLKIF